MNATRQTSFRSRIWSRIAALVAGLVVVLLVISLTLTPLILGLQGPTVIQDGLFSTGLVALFGGLVGLGLTPRRASTVYLDRAGFYKRPSLTGGMIALSLLIAGGILMLSSALVFAL